MRPHVALCAAIMVIAIAAPARAQRQTAKKPMPLGSAVVSGRVFGITEGGDLKPARLANVYLIFEGSEKAGPQSPSDDGTAGRVFIDAVLDNFLKTEKLITKRHEDLAAAHPEGMEFDQDLDCRQKLLALDQSIRDTTEWVLTSKKPKQLLFTDADEEGYFRIAKVPAGRYRLEVRGRAGISDCSWSMNLSLKQGEEASVKLATPGLTCQAVTASD